MAISGNTIASGDSNGRIALTTMKGETVSSTQARGPARMLSFSPGTNEAEQQLCIHDHAGVSVCTLLQLQRGNVSDATAHLASDASDGPVLSCFW
jgi:hypothetical protein